MWYNSYTPGPQNSSDIQYIAFQQLSVEKHYHNSFDHISHVMKIETGTVPFRDSPQPVVPLELLVVLEHKLNKSVAAKILARKCSCAFIALWFLPPGCFSLFLCTGV